MLELTTMWTVKSKFEKGSSLPPGGANARPSVYPSNVCLIARGKSVGRIWWGDSFLIARRKSVVVAAHSIVLFYWVGRVVSNSSLQVSGGGSALHRTVLLGGKVASNSS